MIEMALAAAVSFFATVRWIAYLIFLATRDVKSPADTAEAVRAYRAGPLGDLAEGLARLARSRKRR